MTAEPGDSATKTWTGEVIHHLKVTKTGTGTGTVTSAPAGDHLRGDAPRPTSATGPRSC